MDTPKLALFAAASALALPAMAAAPQGAPEQPVAPARTYAQLLEPIPNASERLKAADNELTVRRYLQPAARYRRWVRGHWVYYYTQPTYHYYYRPYRHYYYRPYYHYYYRPYYNDYDYGPYYYSPVPYLYYHHHHHHHHHHNMM